VPREDTQFKKGNSGGGRPVEHPLKGQVARALWDAMIRLSKMKKESAVKKMSGNPTMTEIVAWKYMQDHPTDFMDRFCGKIPQKQEFGGEVNGTVRVTLNLAAD
jgi:hypothetical protein